ncbi:MAG: SET domain-containing protein-lysine N-methyltransferase [Planctomycetaceae bacterium]|nr:SET domain-containing protein-lysine N-methyltransferase [Planctomycetaceae bacterium]
MSNKTEEKTEHNIPSRCKTDVGKVFSSGVRIGRTSYGLGVFAFAFIPADTPIGRVSGNIILEENYGSDYCISAGDNKVLEPGPPFCYMNHSCEPNCHLVQYTYAEVDEDEFNASDDGSDDRDITAFDEECFYSEDIENEDDKFDEESDEEAPFEEDKDADIWVTSTKDILPGQELTIDYAWPADRAAKCLCGSKSCRGWIVDPKELDELLLEMEQTK